MLDAQPRQTPTQFVQDRLIGQLRRDFHNASYQANCFDRTILFVTHDEFNPIVMDG
jgi:hypothetical protein